MCWAPSEARSKTEAVDFFSAFGTNQKYFLGHDQRHFFNRTHKNNDAFTWKLKCKNTAGQMNIVVPGRNHFILETHFTGKKFSGKYFLSEK